jgi:hypothetical protein
MFQLNQLINKALTRKLVEVEEIEKAIAAEWPSTS